MVSFSSRYQIAKDAAELYGKAAACYKVSESWDKRAAVYLKIAGCYLKDASKYGAASAYENAAYSYIKISTTDALSYFDQAVNQFVEIGKFTRAACCCERIGMLYESEQDFEKSIVYLERAADLFQREENSSTSVNLCKQKINCSVYPRAIEIYEGLAKQSLHLKYDMKGYLLNAGLCQLCEADAVAVAISNAVERYEELDMTFSHEYKFLADLAASVDKVDVQRFTNVVKQFRRITELDAWRSTLLLRVRKS
ncbi:hypothetical protein MKW94_002265 [Papaver nudicaule]|uniref:Alpha-soluble NSF attachment protein n=1 Tax=Papaver nudicaule TaxID=74823 RepID=A0AA41UVI2_PAPNU|nr:hypothetical protein [Papaver nudicaule]